MPECKDCLHFHKSIDVEPCASCTWLSPDSPGSWEPAEPPAPGPSSAQLSGPPRCNAPAVVAGASRGGGGSGSAPAFGYSSGGVGGGGSGSAPAFGYSSGGVGGGGSAGYFGFPDARPEPAKTCENCQHRLDPARAACEFCCALQNWQPRIVAPADPYHEAKHDLGKLRWDCLPWPAVEQVVAVLTFGAEKYSAWSWPSVPDARRRYFAAAIRHAVAWLRGEKTDPESGLSHLAHLACNALFLLSFDLDAAKPPTGIEG